MKIQRKVIAKLLSLTVLGFFATSAFADGTSTTPIAPATPTTPAPAAPAAPATPAPVATNPPIDFGDHKSSTLAAKAWDALNRNDMNAVLAYAKDCITRYATTAQQMQSQLTDYPTGSNADIFAKWALNDVGTVYYIRATGYLNNNMITEAQADFTTIVQSYKFAQCWDPAKNSFWKVGDAAADKLSALNGGYDFGDYSSSTLVAKAWKALQANDLKGVQAYVGETLKLYAATAKQMQSGLKDYPTGTNDSHSAIFQYWALNDVGTAVFVLGQAYQNSGDKTNAIINYKLVISDYLYAQCWDPQGWFWKPADAAQTAINNLGGQ